MWNSPVGSQRTYSRHDAACRTNLPRTAQQFAIAQQILRFGLVPIVEPEVDIHSPRKIEVEDQLRVTLRKELDQLKEDQAVILKLTLPETDDFYRELVEHPRVLALSGGYSRGS